MACRGICVVASVCRKAHGEGGEIRGAQTVEYSNPFDGRSRLLFPVPGRLPTERALSARPAGIAGCQATCAASARFRSAALPSSTGTSSLPWFRGLAASGKWQMQAEWAEGEQRQQHRHGAGGLFALGPVLQRRLLWSSKSEAVSRLAAEAAPACFAEFNRILGKAKQGQGQGGALAEEEMLANAPRLRALRASAQSQLSASSRFAFAALPLCSLSEIRFVSALR